ncbi:hypothetical protein OIO90_004104 [Microbotryomycetes sp. JL221]|nr:hypothetical protein OIO90_004104 [Microbotryomycetes sp. JL221]
MDREQFRKAGYAAIDRVCDYFENLEQFNVLPNVEPGDVGAMLPKQAPDQGEQWSDIVSDFDKVILPGITHWQHPMFAAYFPANTTYESILADIYAGSVSNPGFNWIASPACTELEVVQMDWVAKMLGLDGSFHNASNIGGGIIMTHSLGAKAALILGLQFVAIETFAEDNWALRGETLRKELDQLKEQGKVPFALLATLGSTSTGAIDNISEITTVAANFPELFIHVDAAWAGVFLALPELREQCQLTAINAPARLSNTPNDVSPSGQVHSFCTNLHKSGLVTFDASCLWVRDRKLLTQALDITPPFLRTKQGDQGTVVDFRNWQISLGRKFRSLKVWFTLRSFGVEGFRNHLERLIELTRRLEKLIVEDEEQLFELFTPRSFSLIVVRLRRREALADGTNGADAIAKTNGVPGQQNHQLDDELNKRFYQITTERKDIMLTPTVVGGRACTRIALGSPWLKEDHIDRMWRIMKETAHEAMTKVPQM